MPSPFPGVDPYLEQPDFWPEVHHLLIGILQECLVPQLRPKYRVAIEKRVYEIKGERSLLVGIPDVSIQQKQTGTNSLNSGVAVAAPTNTPLTVEGPMPEEFREGYLEIIDIANQEVVTVIEILSPANKRPGQGREIYEAKREKIFGSRTHFVEIDLLRGGEPLPVFANNLEASYRILVSRRNQRPLADLYLFNLQHSIPSFPLPLRSEDQEPLIDLQTLMNTVYERAGYDFTINYTTEPVPPLSESDAAWVDSILRQQGLRS